MKFWIEEINRISEIRDANPSLEAYCDAFYRKYVGEVSGLTGAWNKYYRAKNIEDLSILFYQYFNEGNLEAIIAGFHNKTAQKLIISYYEQNYKKNNLKEIIGNGHLFKFFSFHPETLLNKNSNDRMLVYLFLFYLPLLDSGLFLYHPVNNDIIIIYPQITFENMEVLLYLLNREAKFDKEKLLETTPNLNHQLIANYIENCMPFTVYRNLGDDWHKTAFPRDKIKLLINNGFGLGDFLKIREKSFYFTPIGLSNIIEDILRECEKNEIENALSGYREAGDVQKL